VYVLIKKLLLENMGKEGKQFFPFILTLFVFISILNLLGVVPYGFAPTAHVVITFGLSMGIFI
jgi:F0F1-type ATP synthase membrane subunit a